MEFYTYITINEVKNILQNEKKIEGLVVGVLFAGSWSLQSYDEVSGKWRWVRFEGQTAPCIECSSHKTQYDSIVGEHQELLQHYQDGGEMDLDTDGIMYVFDSIDSFFSVALFGKDLDDIDCSKIMF